MEDGEADEVALVLDVVRMLIEQSESTWNTWPRWPTRAVAESIVRIRRSYPDLDDPLLVYYLAAMEKRGPDYQRRVQTFLAYRPWLDQEPLFSAVRRGLVTADVFFGLDQEYLAWYAKQELEARRER